MKRILLAEDNEHMRELIQDFLSENEFEVDAKADGLQAWEAIQTRQYHLVLLDVMMPEMDGFTLCQKNQGKGGCPAPVFDSPGTGGGSAAGISVRRG